MSETKFQKHRRILVIDDNPAIHDDFRKILCPPDSAGNSLDSFETVLFGKTTGVRAPIRFHLEFAFQGQEGLQMVRQAQAATTPYAAAFIDMRMPPGWDGVETVAKIW